MKIVRNKIKNYLNKTFPNFAAKLKHYQYCIIIFTHHISHIKKKTTSISHALGLYYNKS